MGPPGSGKGTQAKKLSAHCSIPHLSSGDILRDEVDRKTDFGKMIQDYMLRGEIGPAELIADAVIANLKGRNAEGFILDGFPRTISQAEILDREYKIDRAILLAVPDDLVVQRIIGRRTCPSCGSIYQIAVYPPKKEGECDHCGAGLALRADDNEGTIRKRLTVYYSDTSAVIEHYRSKGLILSIDGSLSESDIFKSITAAI